MENQHRQIKGYRELGEQEIALMNEIKEQGQKLGELVVKLRKHGDISRPSELKDSKDVQSPLLLDQRWISIGTTHLQEGLMALARGVAQPTFF